MSRDDATWTAISVPVENGESVLCNWGRPATPASHQVMAVFPTYSWALERGLGGATDEPIRSPLESGAITVRSETVDFLAAGINVLLMAGIDDLWVLSANVAAGRDDFMGFTDRVRAVVQEGLRRGLALPGGVVLGATSRHGYFVLHAMANIPEVSATMCRVPVVYWPQLEEFLGMDEHPIIKNNALVDWVYRYPPRPLHIETGYNDQRVGTWAQKQLVVSLAEAYSEAGAREHFTHELSAKAGHGSQDSLDTPTIEHDPIDRVEWLREQGIL